MKPYGIYLFSVLSLSILTVPVSFSYAQTSGGPSSANDSVGIQDQVSVSKGGITPGSANDSVGIQDTISVNKTGMNQSANETGAEASTFAQQVVDFVHQSVIDFKAQRNETISAIQQCHENLQNAAPADQNKVRADCRASLDAIKTKYQDERTQFEDLFKQFRNSIITLRMNAESGHADKTQVDQAVNDIKGIKEKELNNPSLPPTANGVAKGLSTKGNSNCVNPPGGPQIC